MSGKPTEERPGWAPDEDLRDLFKEMGSAGDPPVAVPPALRRQRPDPDNTTQPSRSADRAPGLSKPPPAAAGAQTPQTPDNDAGSGSAGSPATKPPAHKGKPSSRPTTAPADHPAGRWVETSMRLPETLVEAMVVRRLTAMAHGGSFSGNQFINDAVGSLPTSVSGLAKALARYRDQINLGLTRRDPGYTPTRLTKVRLTTAVDTALDQAVLDLYLHDNTRVTRQDVTAVAVLRALDAETG